MVALKLAFVTLSRRNESVVRGGVSGEMLNANGPMSRAGGMLGAMIAVMAVTKNAAATSLLKNGTVGVALRFGGFAAATDGRLGPRM
jgi:hypothetical protein